MSGSIARKRALRVRDAILESLQNLVRFPRLGRPQKVEGIRKLLTRRYRYLVYYTLDEEVGEVVILTIQHPRTNASIRTHK